MFVMCPLHIISSGWKHTLDPGHEVNYAVSQPAIRTESNTNPDIGASTWAEDAHM